ncbi:MAG: hypothetical protein A2806_04185 [Candidatus Terrybacteria bacterium RIFCSPHIGHO2_01_FULL_48_17]|uniref:Uncharacterized protein n=1 Tax=Candidatus Terrybacteria bacterium RIFCSPHIGHO2_01_FULL_48_17 TaxID=1802362 RepID=A0A1G2PKK7_9BACT|nr:MAG: hypothetical protein A2806_04185 [Candidatus Terrybacteria bacterium RIFCSPHIGHO2_01_FULL_48_17]OHA53729.1 MAG: hypothetical protein A3A30_05150 [Candidatus Terrybacteria bacterium RIFCSPLOWO2_01_FULL_48_14]
MSKHRAEKEISRPPASQPLRSPSVGSGETERGGKVDACMDNVTARGFAAKMARQIGDEEWRKGNTKYAFEAWEASDITPAELYEIAERLAKSLELFTAAERGYRATAAKVLGWEESRLLNDYIAKDRRVYTSNFFRQAIVACLKLIKRMAA